MHMQSSGNFHFLDTSSARLIPAVPDVARGGLDQLKARGNHMPGAGGIRRHATVMDTGEQFGNKIW
jgi:hypothetical protein